MVLVKGEPKILEERTIAASCFLIFVHGAYEIGNSSKNTAAAAEIRSHSIASTLLYESSRDWDALQHAGTEDEWIAAFEGKTYADELDELRGVIDYVNKKFHPEKLLLSGTSFGAGLMTIVAPEIANLEGILISNPQIRHRDAAREKPLYRGFPPVERFIKAMQHFHGDLTVLLASEDLILCDDGTVYSDAFPLFSASPSPRKRLSIVPANHGYITNEQYPNAEKHYVHEHVHAFR